jgi:hypothetical protein
MKFTVERKVLIKMLKMLSVGGVAHDDHLRIAAQGGQLTLTVEDMAGTSFEAAIAEEGVCFFRHKQLLPLLRAYKAAKSLTMEVNSQGIKFGTTTIGRGLWEISLFENPATAPQRLILKSPEIARGENSGKQPDFGF